MTILTATRLGAEADVSLDPACAIEMVHTASLIVDDMPFMDDATTRRGKPANHKVFGEDIASLASLELLSRAFGVLARAPGLDDRQRIELVRLLSDTIGSEGVIAGQLKDLRAESRTPAPRKLKAMRTSRRPARSLWRRRGGSPDRAGPARLDRAHKVVRDEHGHPVPDSGRPAGPLRDARGHREGRGSGRGEEDARLGPGAGRGAGRGLPPARGGGAGARPAGRRRPALDEMVRSLMGPGMSAVLG
ncbi:MAG: polyprenyl synthetase family protein [Comamonadaceae bacterium]|nr:polyprenyl synthetase family protein [Comamonadaceae bacterium]